MNCGFVAGIFVAFLFGLWGGWIFHSSEKKLFYKDYEGPSYAIRFQGDAIACIKKTDPETILVFTTGEWK